MDSHSSHVHTQNRDGEKFDIHAPETAERALPIPETYNENRLVILPRDPLWFFAYWDLNGEKFETVRREHGADVFERSKPVLRVYQADGPGHDSQGDPHFDVPVQLNTRRWYVQVGASGVSYYVELGLLLSDGRF